MSPMEALSPTSIQEKLNTDFLGQPILYFPRLASTMDAARQAATEGVAEGTLVIADEQTAARGRRGRGWFSPSGSLAFSLVLRPTLAQLPSLIMVASLAVVRTIEALATLRAQIKWPNDVLIGGKKVCGILIESQLKGGGVDFAIVGVGLNVNVALSRFPPLAAPATSLSAELGREVSRVEVLCRLLGEMEKLYLEVRAGSEIARRWRQHLATLGQRVQVQVEGTTMVGVAEGVTREGHLLLRREDGHLARIVAGEVSLRVA